MTEQTVRHPAFPQPVDLNAVIWRYMDLVKFADLVTHRRLYMARADLLGDEHEGTTPAAELARWQHLAHQAESEEQRRIIQANRYQLSEFARDFRQTYYVSCWHMAPDENIAMWERYVRTTDAVAVRSTYSTLRSQLDSTVIHCGMVRYIDYDIQELPSFNRMHLIMHKRHFFADEREVRAVMWSITPENVRHEHVDPFLTADRIGFLASIDPKKLLHSIVLNPKATAELVLRISEICSAHGLPQPVSSRIASRPQF